MSLFSGIGSLAKAVTDPGAVVQDALNAVLPKEIAGVVGNAAAGLVDYYSGNEVMAAKHALEALKDLPQMATALSKQSAGGTARFEPSPKLPTAQSVASSGSAAIPANLQSLLQQLRGLGINITINMNGPAGQTAAPQAPGTGHASADTWRGDTLHHPGAPDNHGWRGHPPAPSSPNVLRSTTADAASGAGFTATSTSVDSSSKADSPSKSTSADNTAATASADSSAKAGSADSTPAMAALNKMSDSDFMNSIQSGKLDPSIKNDPAAMRAIQARMDAISQMNQLLTAMMQAMHQMEMAIIQNIRV